MHRPQAEEKRYLHNIAQYGSPYKPGADEETSQSYSTNSETSKPENAEPVKSFADIVDEFRQTFMVAKLKITTRKGYEAVLTSTLVPKFGELPIEQVNGRAAEDLDLELVKRLVPRRNTHAQDRSARGADFARTGPQPRTHHERSGPVSTLLYTN